MEAVIYGPSRCLVDNTLYGRTLLKKDDGQVGGVQNTSISIPQYLQEKEGEMRLLEETEEMIINFLAFQARMSITR